MLLGLIYPGGSWIGLLIFYLIGLCSVVKFCGPYFVLKEFEVLFYSVSMGFFSHSLTEN